jgi:type III restriction enzyme
MTQITLADYQAETIDKLADVLGTLLRKRDEQDRVVLFRSPTGSGKTLMLANALDTAFESPENPPFVVLWLSPGKGELHLQSQKALARYLRPSRMVAKLLDGRDELVANLDAPAGSVFVVNWEKLRTEKDGEWGNRMLRPGEKANLFTLLETFRNRDFELVVVVDESHSNLDGPQTRKLMDTIRTFRDFIQVETSATPTTSLDDEKRELGLHHSVTVPLSRVQESGVVRSGVVLNADLEKTQLESPEEPLDLQVLKAAWSKREELLAQYRAEGSEVVPLLLVQYPDGERAQARAELVEEFFDELGLDKGSTYAVWLSGDHSRDLEKIAEYNSPYQALIFKQAIATGWDCPRAQVLVQFRPPGSDTFRIQTLGRIMRSPELKLYGNANLNLAYVYSDIEDVSVQVVSEDNTFNVREQKVTRAADYPGDGLILESVFQPRRREYHYPTKQSLEQFLGQKLNDEFFPNLSETQEDFVTAEVMANGQLTYSQIASSDAGFSGQHLDGTLSDAFVQAVFDQLLVARTGPYLSKQQSRTRIKTIVFRSFGENRPDWSIRQIHAASLKHASELVKAIDAACVMSAELDSSKAVAEARSRRRVTTNWEVPLLEIVSAQEWTHSTSRGNLREPALSEIQASGPERLFERVLDEQVKSGLVKWWWKNGIRDERYLGVEYDLMEDSGGQQICYPDYLVMVASGELRVLEVKDLNDREGKTHGKTHAKALGLQAWADRMNNSPARKGGLTEPAPVSAGVVVVVDDGVGKAQVYVGDPDAWSEPSAENIASEKGWSSFAFDD